MVKENDLQKCNYGTYLIWPIFSGPRCVYAQKRSAIYIYERPTNF